MINNRFVNNISLTSIVKLNKAQFKPWVENMEITEILKRGPARLPAKRGQFRAACKLRSHGMHRDVDVDGSWASVLFKAAELDWRTRRVFSEPLVIELGSGMIRESREALEKELVAQGKRKRDLRFYTTDLAVEFWDGRIRFYEMKCVEYHDPNDVRIRQGMNWLACYGYAIDFVLDTYFRETYLERNVNALYQYRHPINTKVLAPIECADLSRKLNVDLKSTIPLFLTGLIASDFKAKFISRHMPVWLAPDRTHLEFLP